MKKPISFARDVLTWHRSLTPAQQSDVRHWLEKNPPPRDWQGAPTEWAYLEMPIPGGW